MFNTQSGHSRAQQGGGPRDTNGDIYFEKLTFIFVVVVGGVLIYGWIYNL